MAKKLTPAVIARLDAIRQRWIDNTTMQATQQQYEELVGKWYAKLGYEMPRVVVVDSPLELVIIGAALARCAVAKVSAYELLCSRLSTLDSFIESITADSIATRSGAKKLVKGYVNYIPTAERCMVDHLLYGLGSIDDDNFQTLLSEAEQHVDEDSRRQMFVTEIDRVSDHLQSTIMARFVELRELKRTFGGKFKEPAPEFRQSTREEFDLDIDASAALLQALDSLDLATEQLRSLVWYVVFKDMCQSYANEVSELVYCGINRFVSNQPYYVGWFWRNWSAFYNMSTELGVTLNKDELELFTQWNDLCSVWTAYDGLIVVSRNPVEVHREDGVLSNTTGPAVKWPDGFSIWSVGGVIVDEQIVMRPETLNAELIAEYGNQEVRRVAIERYGWSNYLSEVNARKLDERHNELDNTYEVLWQAPNGIRALMVGCPTTARVYALQVDDSCRSCKEAQAFLSSGISAVVEIAS